MKVRAGKGFESSWRVTIARLGFVVAVVMMLVFRVSPIPVSAANHYVTNCAGSGMGSLPAVVSAAGSGDTILFALDCFGATPIALTSTININKNLTIDATGHTINVDGGNAVQVFNILGGNIIVTLKGLAILHGNSNGSVGGGISVGNAGVTLYVKNCAIIRNAGGGGAGIGNGGTLYMTNSTVSQNIAANDGGGIYNGGTLAVTNSTFSGNQSKGNFLGGGIANLSGATLTVTNSTFSGNSTETGGGGGIANFLNGNMFASNTLIAGNSGPAGAPDMLGAVTSLGHNLIGNTAGNSGWAASDRTNVAANLGPLTNNGGPMQTIALQAGSPAIGAGDATVCANILGNAPVAGVDQRGMTRLKSVCDIGAYQVQTHLLIMPFDGAAGTFVGIGVSVMDEYNNFVPAYAGTVHFTSSDPLATPPADYTFSGAGGGKDNGTHTAAGIFRTAGTQSVTVTDKQVASVTGNGSGAITPAVSAINPSSGGTAGGNHVTLSGLGFGTIPASVSVTIGGTPATVTNVTNTQLTVAAPAHAVGAADVTVTVSGQGTTVPNGYTYGTVAPLPTQQPVGPAGNGANGLPGSRPAGAAKVGNVNPMPNSRP